MNCDDLRLQLDLAPSVDVSGPEFSIAAKHLTVCPVCKDKLFDRLTIENKIRLTMDPAVPSQEFIDRLMRSVSSPSQRFFGRFGKTAAVLAATLVLSVYTSLSAWETYSQSHAAEKVSKLSILNHETLRDSMRRARTQIWPSAGRGDTRTAFIPQFIDSSEMTGVRRVALDEYPAEAVEFSIAGSHSTLFTFMAGQFGVNGADLPPKPQKGYTVAVWDENGAGYSLVSDAPVDEVRKVYRSLAHR